MSAVWTKEMAEEFLAKSSPDPMFPCSTLRHARVAATRELEKDVDQPFEWSVPSNCCYRPAIAEFALAVLTDDNTAYDALGRCKLKCANCNCRVLFNQLECVKADLETTKETLNITSGYLDDTMTELGEMKVTLEEEKKERNEEKRKFSAAIARMVQSEMGDVRTQLTALNLCLKEELGEKALEKKAASEAAKAALCASNFITLRLLMF